MPLLTGLLGRRRGWAILTRVALMGSIFAMASTSPEESPGLTALLALLVAFSSASQDIVIDAYRVEILKDDEQGAGALWLAALFTWSQVYMIMGGFVVVGMATILFARDPAAGPSPMRSKPT